MVGRNRWVFGLLIALAAQGAWAEGGQINFTGMVLEPTCAADATQADPASALPSQATRHLACGLSAADAGRTYARVVQPVDAASIANDRLLGYLASYAPAGADGKPAASVVVRIYD